MNDHEKLNGPTPMSAGRLVSKEEARAMLDKYLDQPGVTPDHVYGYIFDLKVLKELITKIDSHNATATPDLQVGGIRMYHAISARRGITARDLILVPNIKSDVDLFYVNRNLDEAKHPKVQTEKSTTKQPGNSIGGESRPCPNQC